MSAVKHYGLADEHSASALRVKPKMKTQPTPETTANIY